MEVGLELRPSSSKISVYPFIYSFYKYFFKRLYLFIHERQRDRERESKGRKDIRVWKMNLDQVWKAFIVVYIVL